MDEINQIFDNTKERMEKSIESLVRELSSVRTGRASTGLVENINVDYYGTPTPINQLSSISIPEARSITIQPWDQNALIEIEKALLQSNLGMTPTNDGEMIRINVPALTEERRKEMVKSVGGISENSNVSLRNIRRDSLEKLRDLEKDKTISQDESKKAQQDLQKITDDFTAKVDNLKKDKENELLQI
ncbi:MAG: ribosome recycling factor [Dehalococcoidia bacterium]